MKPIEYLAALDAEWPREAISTQHIDNVVPWLRAELGEQSQAPLNEAIKDLNNSNLNQEIFANLRSRLPGELLAFFEHGFIVCAEINDPAPKAYMQPLDEGFAIVFTSGLKGLIYRVARIIATRFVPKGGADVKFEGTTFAETARFLAEVFWWVQMTGRAFGPDYPIAKQQILIASRLASEAETFLLAHEIGHIIDQASAHTNPLFRKLSGSLTFDHRTEHVADAIGLRLALETTNIAEKRSGDNLAFTYAGIEFALQVYRALGQVGLEVADTHPSASSRLRFIRSEMRAGCPSKMLRALTSMASSIETLFSEAIKIIKDPGEHAIFFDQSAKRIVSQIDELLTKCTGELVPDYMTFYKEAPSIVDAGYPHEILDKAATIASEFFNITPRTIRQKREESWVKFQKFKLLFAFAREHMPEPARSLFLTKLGIPDGDG